MYFANEYGYAAGRVDGTYVRHDGKLCYVSYTNMEGQSVIQYVGSDEQVTVSFDELDLRPLKMGYVNSERGLRYIVRMPKRHDWRQGTRQRNIIDLLKAGRDVDFKELASTVFNIFPTFKEALEKGEAAFTRKWAVKGDELHYRCKVVGKIVEGEPVLADEFNYLDVALEEVL